MKLHKTRFAPSPNGKLHLGHAFSAIVSERVAKNLMENFLLELKI